MLCFPFARLLIPIIFHVRSITLSVNALEWQKRNINEYVSAWYASVLEYSGWVESVLVCDNTKFMPLIVVDKAYQNSNKNNGIAAN